MYDTEKPIYFGTNNSLSITFAVMKHRDQTNLGRKELFVSHFYITVPYKKRSGQELKQFLEVGADIEAMKVWYYWLGHHSLIVCCLIECKNKLQSETILKPRRCITEKGVGNLCSSFMLHPAEDLDRNLLHYWKTDLSKAFSEALIKGKGEPSSMPRVECGKSSMELGPVIKEI